MASTIPPAHRAPSRRRLERPDHFAVVETAESLGRNVPQRLGRVLWAPALAMALGGFAAGIVLAVVRARAVANGADAQTIAALAQFVPAAMFLGFASVFAAISFAVARILGEFRAGGGDVQAAAGVPVQTMRMPVTAKAFLTLMMAAMMTILAAVALHVLIGSAILNDSMWAMSHAEQWAAWLEGARRIGVAVYLFAIGLGLASIVTVLRFQAIRIRELPDLPRQRQP